MGFGITQQLVEAVSRIIIFQILSMVACQKEIGSKDTGQHLMKESHAQHLSLKQVQAGG